MPATTPPTCTICSNPQCTFEARQRVEASDLALWPLVGPIQRIVPPPTYPQPEAFLAPTPRPPTPRRRAERNVFNPCDFDVTKELKFYGYPSYKNVEGRIDVFGSANDPVFFGIELEVEISQGRNQDYYDGGIQESIARSVQNLMPDTVRMKTDGSLDYGFEIVSAPATLEEHKKMWRGFFDNKPQSLAAKDSCGLHIHLSRPGPLHTARIYVFINNPKWRDMITDIAGREESTYAEFSTHSEATGNYYRCRQNLLFSSRYVAVNPMNADTLELRLFASTLEETTFFSRLEFAHAVYFFTEQNVLADMNWKNFVSFVDTRRHTYPHLVNKLFDMNEQGISPTARSGQRAHTIEQMRMEKKKLKREFRKSKQNIRYMKTEKEKSTCV